MTAIETPAESARFGSGIRWEVVSIWIATLLAGAILMSLEVLGFRIIGKTFGSALRETSVVISVCLTAMSIGYFIGGRAADLSEASDSADSSLHGGSRNSARTVPR